MPGEILEVDELMASFHMADRPIDHEAGSAAGDAISAEESAFAPHRVSSTCSEAGNDDEPQPAAADADIAFVGDQPPSDREGTPDDDKAALADEAHETEKDLVGTGEDTQWWYEEEALWVDEFAFHPDDAEARGADSSEKDVEELITFHMVSECPPSESAPSFDSEEGEHTDEFSFTPEDLADSLL